MNPYLKDGDIVTATKRLENLAHGDVIICTQHALGNTKKEIIAPLQHLNFQ